MGLFKLVGSLIGGNSAKKSAKKAAQLQYDAAMAGVAETARQFDATRADFASEQAAGEAGLDRLLALIGLNGADEQQGEIDALQESPLYKSLYRTGEESLLANASATGGLRGGNTERSLADFSADTLSQVIAQQLANYGGLVGVGTGADGAVGNFGANAVAQQANLRNMGAGAKAQYQLIKGGINNANWNNVGSTIEDTLKNILAPGSGGFSFKNVFG